MLGPLPPLVLTRLPPPVLQDSTSSSRQEVVAWTRSVVDDCEEGPKRQVHHLFFFLRESLALYLLSYIISKTKNKVFSKN